MRAETATLTGPRTDSRCTGISDEPNWKDGHSSQVWEILYGETGHVSQWQDRLYLTEFEFLQLFPKLCYIFIKFI